MMFMCTSKFDIESEQLTLVDEYLTAQEIQAARRVCGRLPRNQACIKYWKPRTIR